MKIIVVGGGSAGWMIAAYLAKHTDSDISLIESANIPIVGVGESTLASMPQFFETIGITEDDLFKECSAVRKYTIKHHNWNGENDEWNHRFCFNKSEEEQQDKWMEDYIKPDVKWRWAYHLDATKLGTLIKEKSAIPFGVHHIVDDINEVVVSNDKVEKLIGNNGTYVADMYVDCTGSRSLIRGKLPAIYKSHKSLINNCAICGPGFYDDNEVPARYTETFAMDYGWRWRVTLQHRTGNGYAFNKDLISIEQATEEFISKTPNLHKDKLFVVNIENKYNTEPWKGNVISFGLSSGFLEPLEATGIFLIYAPLKIFTKLMHDPNGSIKLNKLWNRLYNHVAEFVALIFETSKLNHTEYWRRIPKVSEISPNPVFFKDVLFTEYNYRSLAEARGIPYNPAKQ